MNTDSSTSISELRQQYLEAILQGNESAALNLIEGALASGFRPPFLYLRIIAPAQRTLGELWAEGKVSLGQEHNASQIALDIMSLLRLRAHRTQPNGLRAIVVAVDGDRHQVKARIMADFLYIDGWDVDFVANDHPHDLIIQLMNERQIALVLLCKAHSEDLNGLKNLITSIKERQSSIKVLVGGPGLRGNEGEWRAAADGTTTEIHEVSPISRDVCGLERSDLSLDNYLRSLGARISTERKSQRLSQQDLAEIAGLDRAYISSLENGRQNVTIGVVHKIANGLNISLNQLLIGE